MEIWSGHTGTPRGSRKDKSCAKIQQFWRLVKIGMSLHSNLKLTVTQLCADVPLKTRVKVFLYVVLDAVIPAMFVPTLLDVLEIKGAMEQKINALASHRA